MVQWRFRPGLSQILVWLSNRYTIMALNCNVIPASKQVRHWSVPGWKNTWELISPMMDARHNRNLIQISICLWYVNPTLTGKLDCSGWAGNYIQEQVWKIGFPLFIKIQMHFLLLYCISILKLHLIYEKTQMKFLIIILHVYTKPALNCLFLPYASWNLHSCLTVLLNRVWLCPQGEVEKQYLS